MRIGTNNAYTVALEHLYKRQSDMVDQQEKLSSGLAVNRASDDPTGMAQAERVQANLKRVATDQRALELQRNAITAAEAALGDAGDQIQAFRDFVLKAGNAAYNEEDRAILAKQMIALRDQVFAAANRTDSNGVALFGGLGSTGTPFADQVTTVDYQGTPGQRAATASSLPGAMDGEAIWMSIGSGNGTFEVGLGAGNTGGMWSDPGTVVSPAALTGNNYSITFSVVNNVTTYEVTDTTLGTVVATGQPYTDGMSIQFDGMSIAVNGAPANGDTLTVAPSTASNVFEVLDKAIAAVNGARGGNQLSHALARSLVEIDSSLERLQSAQSQAGDWLNRADTITDTHSARTIQLSADRARAVELDPVKGLSDFSTMQTAYQTALQSYASIQKLSLFNFIN